MPLRLSDGTWIKPTSNWQSVTATEDMMQLKADKNFFVTVKKV